MDEIFDALWDDQNFRALEEMLNVFCPFEAVGMVHQEIRHAHYLAYILNPNKPHGFGIKPLNAFLRLALGKEIPADSDAQYGDIKIIRERDDIDLRIEIPGGMLQEKAIVLAVELKINAAESAEQLEKYRGIVDRQYRGWDKRYIFLTKHGTAARNSKDRAEWKPMALADLIPKFKEALENKGSGQSVDFFKAYIRMMGRKHLGDKEIKQKAAELWDAHSDVLEILMKYQPDRAKDIMQYLAKNDELLEKLKENTPLEICKTTSSRKILRFHFNAWDSLPGMKAKSSGWVKSQSIIVIEVYIGLKKDIRITYCLDRSGNMDETAEQNRKAIHEKSDHLNLSEWVDQDWAIPPYKNNHNHIHLHKAVLWSRDERKSNSEFSNDIEGIAISIIEKAGEFLKHTFPEYDKVITAVSPETAEHIVAASVGEANPA